MHCDEPPCVEECPEDAIKKRREDGIVVVDREKCTGCRRCLEVCPFDVPQFGRDDKMQKCDLCISEIDLDRGEQPPCIETCSTATLRVVRMGRSEKVEAEESMKKLLNI
jgi:anaerobic dimethyl sulfoxide reductase subunit B (iron-sulfur subunit)